jgi:hypothetical protein
LFWFSESQLSTAVSQPAQRGPSSVIFFSLVGLQTAKIKMSSYRQHRMPEKLLQLLPILPIPSKLAQYLWQCFSFHTNFLPQTASSTEVNFSWIIIGLKFLIAVFEEALLRNIIITLRIHYTIIITSIINNNEIINNYRKLEDLISLFKIPMGARKNSFDIYRQMEHGPSKRFAKPGLQQSSPSAFSIYIEFFQVSHYAVFPQFPHCKQAGRRGEDGGVRIKNATLLVYSFPITITTCLCGTLLYGPTVEVSTSEF